MPCAVLSLTGGRRCPSALRRSRPIRSTIPTRLPSARRPASPRRPVCSPRRLSASPSISASTASPACNRSFAKGCASAITSYEERLSGIRAEGKDGASSRGILDGFLAASENSLAAIARTVNETLLDKAIAILAGAETIYILARRRSYPVASYIAYALGKLKVRNQIVEFAVGSQSRNHLLRDRRVMRHLRSASRPTRRRRSRRRGCFPNRACRSWPSPTAPFRRWRNSPESGSRWRRPITSDSDRFRQPWRWQ